MISLPDAALVRIPAVDGGLPVLLVAPHGTAPLAAAQPLVHDDDDTQRTLAERVADWHDEGSAEALEAAAAALGAVGFRPTVPRAVLDLNRGWRGRAEAAETLFGKGALDAWTGARLRPGAAEALQLHHAAALATLAEASRGVQGFVELHSYGDLGSTYDRNAGGRPVRRAEAAIVDATPWASAHPVGLARLLPGDLRGTPWPLVRELGDALTARGFAPGPSPYPSQGPWALSTRFLAARWFGWLGRTGRVPEACAGALAELAWTDEQSPALDAALDGGGPAALDGVRDLARLTGAWSHEAGDLGRRFLTEDGAFTVVAELRVDRAEEGPAFGEAVAAGVRTWLAAHPA
jgi:hypothetical protein